MRTIQSFLYDIEACEELQNWSKNKTIEEIVAQCHVGDWLLSLAKKTNLPLKKLTLAKALCAKTVIHLMKDSKSINAVNIAEKFGLTDEVTLEELNAASEEALTVLCSFDGTCTNFVAGYAAAAAYTASHYAASGYVAESTAHASYHSATHNNGHDIANKNQKETSDICREVFGKELIESINNILKS